MLDNVKIHGVTREAYFAATELGEDLKLAVDFMRLNDVKEIYSFDEDFHRIEEYAKEGFIPRYVLGCYNRIAAR